MKTEKHRDRGSFGQSSACVRTRQAACCALIMLLGFRLRPQSSISPTRERSSRIPLPFGCTCERESCAQCAHLPCSRVCRSRAHASAQVSIRLRFKTACVALGTMTAAWCSQRDASFAKVEGKGLPWTARTLILVRHGKAQSRNLGISGRRAHAYEGGRAGFARMACHSLRSSRKPCSPRRKKKWAEKTSLVAKTDVADGGEDCDRAAQGVAPSPIGDMGEPRPRGTRQDGARSGPGRTVATYR